MMLRLAVLAAVALGLAACAQQQAWKEPPGKYDNYRQAVFLSLLRAMSEEHWGDVPSSTRLRLAGCAADMTVANVTPAQLEVLDAAARGEREAPAELGAQVERQLEQAWPSVEKGDFSGLEPYCPEDIPEFRKYVRS